LLGTFFNGFVLATVLFHLNRMPYSNDKSAPSTKNSSS
jgi:hypothetical protein